MLELLILLVQAAGAPHERPTTPATEVLRSSCPVTLAAERPFPEPSPSTASRFWYGDEKLAVLLKAGGRWRGMGPDRSYRDKLFWWRQGYDGTAEPTPKLIVTGRRLDGDAPALAIPGSTGANHPDFGGWAMLVGVEFPVAGCWQVTGEYGAHKLTFVVDVRE
jgi:hypothetical protein